MDKVCPICNNFAPFRIKKGQTEYNQCINCKTVFSNTLDNDNMIGGVAEVERNEQQNAVRIDRLRLLTERVSKEDLRFLDFGCGNGLLIKDLQKEGYNCDGYDAYNEAYCTLPEHGKYHAISAIEVCEHFSAPYSEYDVMWRSLIPSGIIMIETSFTDVAAEEGIELEDFFYLNPDAGHSTLYSHHGLDLLMALKGFMPGSHLNRHVRIYQKINCFK